MRNDISLTIFLTPIRLELLPGSGATPLCDQREGWLQTA